MKQESMECNMRLVMAILLAIAGAWLCVVTSGSAWSSGSASKPSSAKSQRMEIYPTWDITQRAGQVAIPLTMQGRSSLRVVDLSRKDDGVLKIVAGGVFAAWAHSGGSLAYSGEPHRGITSGRQTCKVGLFSLADRSLSVLRSAYEDRHPVWSRDDSRLAFVRWVFGDPLKAEPNTGYVMIVPIRGATFGKVRSLKCEPSGTLPDALEWHPLQDKLAYVGLGSLRGSVRQSRDVYLLDVATSRNEKLTALGDVQRYSLSWSPDGNYIAFAREKNGVLTLNTMDVRTRKLAQISLPTSPLSRRLHYVKTVRWSADGKKIAFDACIHDRGAGGNIGLVEWPSLKAVWLTSDGSSWAPRWTEGNQIAFVRNRCEIWCMESGGTKQDRLWPSRR